MIVPVPKIPSTIAAIIVVILPSIIAESAFLKPFPIAERTDLPRPISSLIRVNIITFASTAIPIESTIPAIPGRVSVICKSCKSTSSITTYAIRAKLEASPGILYTTIINKNTMAKPIRPAKREVSSAVSPSFAPTTLERTSLSSRGRAPTLIIEASLSASSMELCPEI